MYFVEEHDPDVNPLGIKGVGEIGIVGVAAAIANAIYHARASVSASYQLPQTNCSNSVIFKSHLFLMILKKQDLNMTTQALVNL